MREAAPGFRWTWLLVLAGCAALPPSPGQAGLEMRGHVSFAVNSPDRPTLAGTSQDRPTLTGTSPYRVLALLAEVANAATVSLIEAQGGNTVASSVTDERGGFVLTFQNFTPVSGAPYTLEAVKGLAVGGKPNRPGAAAVRVRSLLFWNGGWQSLTNSVPGVGISVSPATTAIATIASLKQSARQSVDLTELVGKVSGGDFDATGTDLSRTADFDPVVRLVDNALTLDQDPVAAIAYDSVRGTYRLATGVPLAVGIEPAIPTPGQSLTIRGLNFDPTPGRNVFWFGSIPVTAYSVSPDRSALTSTVPPGAFSAPFRLQQPGGTSQVVHPFLPLKGTVGTLAGDGVSGFRDGPGAQARFSATEGLALDGSGNLYVGDNGTSRVRKVSPAGMVSTLAGGSSGDADGVGEQAQLRGPHGVVLDRDGNVYVAEYYGNRIRKISPGGIVTRFAGDGPAGSVDGAGTAARFWGPVGIGIDASGNFYVGDRENHRIRKITPQGVVSTFAGSTAGYADGTGTAASFRWPQGIAVDPAGNVYVADTSNNRIRKITPQGVVSTLAGSGAAGGADGTGPAAQFNSPDLLALDPGGNVYVTDYVGRKVRKVSPAGVVTTLAGTGIKNWRDGSLAVAEFDDPEGVAVDSLGIVYIAEYGGGRIRVITP